MDKPLAKEIAVSDFVPPQDPTLGWASDVAAEMLQRSGLKYISLVPGASYRGLHDSIVNYLGNKDPEMVLCLTEQAAVGIAHGYAKVTGKPMAVALHANIGVMHAAINIFDAFADRMPMVIMGATGPVDAAKRRPWIDWIHTSADQASMVRDYLKWDDQPGSAEAIADSVLRATLMASTAPMGPTYVCLDAALQEEPLDGPVALPDPKHFPVAAPPGPDAASLATSGRRSQEPRARSLFWPAASLATKHDLDPPHSVGRSPRCQSLYGPQSSPPRFPTHTRCTRRMLAPLPEQG